MTRVTCHILSLRSRGLAGSKRDAITRGGPCDRSDRGCCGDQPIASLEPPLQIKRRSRTTNNARPQIPKEKSRHGGKETDKHPHASISGVRTKAAHGTARRPISIFFRPTCLPRRGRLEPRQVRTQVRCSMYLYTQPRYADTCQRRGIDDCDTGPRVRSDSHALVSGRWTVGGRWEGGGGRGGGRGKEEGGGRGVCLPRGGGEGGRGDLAHTVNQRPRHT